MSDAMWNNEEPVADLGIEVPAWIEQDISPSQVAAILQGGCSSGAYMPAVTYHTAGQTMAAYGDDILQYLEDAYGDVPAPKPGESWSGMACHFLSAAVEAWASSVESEIEDALEALEDETETEAASND